MFRGMKAFKKIFVDFSDDIPRGGHKAIRQEAMSWFGEVVELTPVDTGFASSQWKFSINKRPTSTVIRHPGPGKTYPGASTPAFTRLRQDDTLFIYNNASNIRALEQGHSSQAPTNFFKNSARRAQRRLENRFKELARRA